MLCDLVSPIFAFFYIFRYKTSNIVGVPMQQVDNFASDGLIFNLVTKENIIAIWDYRRRCLHCLLHVLSVSRDLATGRSNRLLSKYAGD
jgi:hypothetical protein